MKSKEKKVIKSVFNPFEGRNSEEVWTEIRKHKGPRVSREEALRTMESLAIQKERK